MKQLFLTSSVNMVAHDIAKKLDLSSKNTLVFIDTPAEPEKGDRQWLMDDRQSLLRAGFKVTDYTITGKNQKQLEDDLSAFDYIYMSGGDTYYLLEKSVESGFITVIRDLVLKKEKTYIGTSAGSIICGEKCCDYLFEEDARNVDMSKDGYGLVNFTILPHWGSEHFRSKYSSNLLHMGYQDDQVPLLILTDTQYVHVEGENMRIIETR